jgi:hypothetical protein
MHILQTTQAHMLIEVILVFMFVCRIQIGKAASVKTAATLVRELSYQNKV